jgi:hypothetical protein
MNSEKIGSEPERFSQTGRSGRIRMLTGGRRRSIGLPPPKIVYDSQLKRHRYSQSLQP